MSWRYKPIPESADGAGLASSLLFVAAAALPDGIRGVPLVCETLRTRVLVEVGVVVPAARLPMLPSQAGLAPPTVSFDLTLAFAWLSSELAGLREVGVVCVRRLGPRTCG